MPSSVIIGSGIVGLSAAWHLVRRGHRVTVLDRGPIGGGASYGNAGLVALGHPPLTRPGVTGQGLRWMFDRRAPLYIPPRADVDLVRWLWSFQRHCTARHFEHCMSVLAPLGWAAGHAFREILDLETIDCDWRSGGWLDVCLTERALDHGEHDAGLLREHGYRVERLDRSTLLEQQPAFREEIAGAWCYADSACCSPSHFVHALARACERRGAALRPGCGASRLRHESGRVTGVELDSGEILSADGVLLAAGAWTTELARQAGVAVPMQAAKGYHQDLDPVGPVPSLGCVLNETFIAVTPMYDRLRLAGTLELTGLNSRTIRRRVEMLRAGAGRYLRAIDDARPVATWNGLRPCTADGLPVCGPSSRLDRLYVATGGAMMGWTLGPLMGRAAAAGLDDGAPDPAEESIGALAVDRFER